jgi:hypothetical protein
MDVSLVSLCGDNLSLAEEPWNQKFAVFSGPVATAEAVRRLLIFPKQAKPPAPPTSQQQPGISMPWVQTDA